MPDIDRIRRVAGVVPQDNRETSGLTGYAAIDAGSYKWRRDRGLLGLNDHIHRYRAIRAPRDPHRVPLPNDYIEGRRD